MHYSLRLIFYAASLFSTVIANKVKDTGWQHLSPSEAKSACSPYSALFSNIDSDLERWKAEGISLELMQRTIARHTHHRGSHGGKGVAFGFLAGRAYLLDEPQLEKAGHHGPLLLIVMQMIMHLERTFKMPDVDFVVNTVDRPLDLVLNASDSSAEPVMRFCKGDSSADVLIPMHHFNMKDFDQSLLEQIPAINEKYPWPSKKDVAFGRFSLYDRHLHPGDPAMPARKGFKGKNICTASPTTIACEVRAHFIEWAKKNRPKIDVSNSRRVAMSEHAAYRYLVHLDGQGLSSRLDQLLPLGSLVLKEESGYRAFYHHLIKPNEHYLPFWKERPEEILDVLKWARENDAEAQRIARQGQAVARDYLNKQARACYWYKLLSELSKLLKYKPGKVEGRKYMESYIPVDEYLETTAPNLDKGKALKRFKFTP